MIDSIHKPSDLIYANNTYLNNSSEEPAQLVKSPSDTTIIIIVVCVSCAVSSIMIALSIYWCLIARKKPAETPKGKDIPSKSKSVRIYPPVDEKSDGTEDQEPI